MVVEDEPTFQDLVELVVSLDARFEIVYKAGSGEEALQKLEETSPDLVLLDFRLPGIDGLETATRLMEQRPDIRIAMVTAHSEEVIGRIARETGIQEVIPKASFNLERFIES